MQAKKMGKLLKLPADYRMRQPHTYTTILHKLLQNIIWS